MSNPQSTAAEALTLQLAVNEMVYAEKGKHAQFLQLAEFDPFHAISSFTLPITPVVASNLFTIKVDPAQCLVLTYIRAYVSPGAAFNPTDAQLSLFNEIIPQCTGALGTRQNGVNKLETIITGLDMYVNTPICYAWPGGTTTLMNILPANAATWTNLTANGYSCFLQWSGYFLPGQFFGPLDKLRTLFISSN